MTDEEYRDQEEAGSEAEYQEALAYELLMIDAEEDYPL